MVAAERRQVDEKVKKIIELKNKVENILLLYVFIFTCFSGLKFGHCYVTIIRIILFDCS